MSDNPMKILYREFGEKPQKRTSDVKYSKYILFNGGRQGKEE